MAKRSSKSAKVSKTLTRAIAHGDADRSIKRALGLTRTALAAQMGISPRALGRYLSGERKWPSDALERAQATAKAANVRLSKHASAIAAATNLKRPRALARDLVARRHRPFKDGTPSEIIIVETPGLTADEVADIVATYHDELKPTGQVWQMRLFAYVPIKKSFSDQNRKDQKGYKDELGDFWVPRWIPEFAKLVDPRFARTAEEAQENFFELYGSLVADGFFDIDDEDEEIEEPADFGAGISAISFLPEKAKTKKSRYQKRRGKH